jgi:hypothetical protein
MKRKELDRDKLLSLCKFLESVLTDEEISELAGMLLGGEKRNERRKN